MELREAILRYIGDSFVSRPLKGQVVYDIADNYGYDSRQVESELYSCIREGLIQVHNGRYTISQAGRDLIYNKQRINYIELAYENANLSKGKRKKKPLTESILFWVTIITSIVTVYYLFKDHWN